MRRGWFGLLLQKNATFNQQFRETIEPLRGLSSLDAREYYDQKAYEPLRREFRVAPGMFYNFGGKLALSRSPWDAHLFPARVHDEDGRITLLLLQAQIEERPDLDVATLVRSSTLRNPYTGEAMEYDARAGTLGFACLHTAFHPPEPADQCAVARRGLIGRPGAAVQCAPLSHGATINDGDRSTDTRRPRWRNW